MQSQNKLKIILSIVYHCRVTRHMNAVSLSRMNRSYTFLFDKDKMNAICHCAISYLDMCESLATKKHLNPFIFLLLLAFTVFFTVQIREIMQNANLRNYDHFNLLHELQPFYSSWWFSKKSETPKHVKVFILTG